MLLRDHVSHGVCVGSHHIRIIYIYIYILRFVYTHTLRSFPHKDIILHSPNRSKTLAQINLGTLREKTSFSASQFVAHEGRPWPSTGNVVEVCQSCGTQRLSCS